jgi:hypothetical protein
MITINKCRVPPALVYKYHFTVSHLWHTLDRECGSFWDVSREGSVLVAARGRRQYAPNLSLKDKNKEEEKVVVLGPELTG